MRRADRPSSRSKRRPPGPVGRVGREFAPPFVGAAPLAALDCSQPAPSGRVERGCPIHGGRTPPTVARRCSAAHGSSMRASPVTAPGVLSPGCFPPCGTRPLCSSVAPGLRSSAGPFPAPPLPLLWSVLPGSATGFLAFQPALVLPVGFPPLGRVSRSCGFGRVHGSFFAPRCLPTIHFALNVGRSDLRSRSA